MAGRTTQVLNQSKELLKYLTYISSRSFVQIGCGVGRAYEGRGDLAEFATCRILECDHSQSNNFFVIHRFSFQIWQNTEFLGEVSLRHN